MTNNKPVVSESGEAAWRRIRLIPFNVVIPPAERDPDLIDRLRDEWPGILAWLVRGCLDWQQHGLQDPEAVRVATAEYRNESDLIGQFMQECCDISPDKWVPSARLRAEYERWSAERGVRPLAGKAFTARLRDHGADDEKKQGVRGWAGVGMRGDG